MRRPRSVRPPDSGTPPRPAGEALASRPFATGKQTAPTPAGHPLDRYLAQRKSLAATPAAPLIIQRSKIDSHQSSGEKQTPNAILEKEFGKDLLFRLKALPRKKQKVINEDEEQTSLWVNPQEITRKKVDRAEKVTATLEGKRRLSGTRKSDAMQTEIGSLGEQERAILGRSPEKSYEGGHLIGDQFLGEASYKEWNLAPQARKLNNPYYKEVEGMLATGLVHKTTREPDVDIPIQVTVEVTYTDDPYDVTVQELVDRKVITPEAAKGKDANKKVAFPRFVPSQWTLTASFDEKHAEEYELPQKTLTEKMGKMTINKPPLKRVPSQESLTIPSDLKSIENDKFVLGGGKKLSLQAFQHFPHPGNEAKGTKLDLGKLIAPPTLKTRFKEPMNVLKLGKDKESFEVALGYLDQGKNDPTDWAAVAHYIIQAAKKGASSKLDLLTKAEDVFKKSFGGYTKNTSTIVPKELRNKLREILLYDAYIKGSPEEVELAKKYQEVDYIGYSEEEQEEEEGLFIQDESEKKPSKKVEKRKVEELLKTVPQEEIEKMETKKKKVEDPQPETGTPSGESNTTVTVTTDLN